MLPYLAIILIGTVFGEDVTLEPGKPFIFTTPGYPNSYENPGESVYNVKSSPGSKIYAYCDDYRTVGGRENPCNSFKLTFDDGQVSKHFCSLENFENVYHLSAGNSLKITMNFPIRQLVSCVVRSTESTSTETIVLSPSNHEVFLQGYQEPYPYMDQTWLIKSENGEKMTVDCHFHARKTPFCYAERYEINLGSETKTICDSEKILQEVTGKDVTIRAVYDKYGYGGPDCRISVERPPQVYVPPTLPPPEKTTEKVFLDGSKVHEFTSPCYPFGNGCSNSDTTYIFESAPGSTIDIVCEDFRMAGGVTPCDKYQVTFDDGTKQDAICETSSDVYRASSSNKFTINMKFETPVAIKCVARSSAVPNPEQVQLNLHEPPFIFERKYEDPVEPYKHKQYSFSTKQGLKISIQCDITFRMKDKCTVSKFQVDNGESVETFCGSTKFVVISKANELKAKFQFARQSYELFHCLVQPITGPNANEHKNVVSEEVDSTERGSSPGQVRTTCDCGRRVWPKKNVPGRIFDGKIARESEYTWMVGIRDSSNFQRCGGSLITQHHVLTAAHCMVDDKTRVRDEIYETVIAIGAHDLNKSQKEQASHGETQYIDVLEKNVFIPEEWWKFEKHYDIAVLLMEKPAKFGLHVGPVCMAKKSPKLLNREIKVTGWGTTETQRASALLKETKVFVIATEICHMQPYIMCTYKNWTGTCKGDSGSPLVDWDADTNRYTQVSLVSFGYTYECTPGLTGNTNVTYFYDWINSKVKETKPNAEMCTRVE